MYTINDAIQNQADKIQKQRAKKVAPSFTAKIYDWMFDYDLTPAELLVFAVIYQFAKPTVKTTFNGSIAYLEASLHYDRKTITSALSTLRDKGIVTRNKADYGNDVLRWQYKVLVAKMPRLKSFLTVYGWMFELKLTAAELLTYAYIYSFCCRAPADAPAYAGNTSKICRDTHLSRASVNRALKSLVYARKIGYKRISATICLYWTLPEQTVVKPRLKPCVPTPQKNVNFTERKYTKEQLAVIFDDIHDYEDIEI